MLGAAEPILERKQRIDVVTLLRAALVVRIASVPDVELDDRALARELLLGCGIDTGVESRGEFRTGTLATLARDAIVNGAPLAMTNGYNSALNTVRDTMIVLADAPAVSRALANLLGNAIAHGGNCGTIEVRVTADGAIEVADEGPGVPLETQERMFGPFCRERWDKDGCGLGLHLVREIMHATAGRRASREEGMGGVPPGVSHGPTG